MVCVRISWVCGGIYREKVKREGKDNKIINDKPKFILWLAYHFPFTW